MNTYKLTFQDVDTAERTERTFKLTESQAATAEQQQRDGTKIPAPDHSFYMVVKVEKI